MTPTLKEQKFQQNDLRCVQLRKGWGWPGLMLPSRSWLLPPPGPECLTKSRLVNLFFVFFSQTVRKKGVTHEGTHEGWCPGWVQHFVDEACHGCIFSPWRSVLRERKEKRIKERRCEKTNRREIGLDVLKYAQEIKCEACFFFCFFNSKLGL